MLIHPFVRASGGYLLVGFLAGAALAVNLTTGWLAPAGRTTFSAHVAAAVGGWFVMLLIGISYHLLTFFGFVDKKHVFRWPTAVRRLLHTGIGLALVGAALPSLGQASWASTFTGAAALVIAVACILFVWDGSGLYGRRGRERMHPAVGHVRAAHLYLLLCALLLGIEIGRASCRERV